MLNKATQQLTTDEIQELTNLLDSVIQLSLLVEAVSLDHGTVRVKSINGKDWFEVRKEVLTNFPVDLGQYSE